MISTIYEAIFSEMKARGSSATLVSGLDKLEENQDAPRVVFYPEKDSFDRGVMNPGGPQRTIVDRWAGHHVRLWSVTIDQMDVLIAQVVCCVHVTMKRANQETRRAGVYRIDGGGFVNDGARLVKRGFEYDFAFSVCVPILDRVWTPPDPDGQLPGDEQSTYRDPAVSLGTVAVSVKETIGGQTETVIISETK